MKSAFIAMAALAAAASAQSVGYAVVVNKCTESTWLYNVPSADGGCTEEDKVLESGESYTQQYTALTNGNGWSIKLANSSTAMADNSGIMQYEYTFQNDGLIWYDMSDVNGNPWDGNWKFSSSDSACTPTHLAYQYSTDDANGMQAACSQSANITVILCAMDDSSDGSDATATAASSVFSTTVAQSSTAAPSTTVAASTTPVSTSSAAESTSATSAHSKSWKQDNVSQPTTTTAAAPSTTLATSVLTTSAIAVSDNNVVWVTDVAYTTEYVTAAAKRDTHHQHQHHARHPHGRA